MSAVACAHSYALPISRKMRTHAVVVSRSSAARFCWLAFSALTRARRCVVAAEKAIWVAEMGT